MINESLTIGLLLAVVFGGVCFYLYTRIVYTEKRIGLMENILLDIKMSQEQKPLHVLPPIPNEVAFEDTVHRVQTLLQEDDDVKSEEVLEQVKEKPPKKIIREIRPADIPAPPIEAPKKASKSNKKSAPAPEPEIEDSSSEEEQIEIDF